MTGTWRHTRARTHIAPPPGRMAITVHPTYRYATWRRTCLALRCWYNALLGSRDQDFCIVRVDCTAARLPRRTRLCTCGIHLRHLEACRRLLRRHTMRCMRCTGTASQPCRWQRLLGSARHGHSAPVDGRRGRGCRRWRLTACCKLWRRAMWLIFSSLAAKHPLWLSCRQAGTPRAALQPSSASKNMAPLTK